MTDPDFIPPTETPATYPRGSRLREEVIARWQRGETRSEIEVWLREAGMPPTDAAAVVDLVLIRHGSDRPPPPEAVRVAPAERPGVLYVRGTTNADVGEQLSEQAAARRRRAAALLDEPAPDLAFPITSPSAERLGDAGRSRRRFWLIAAAVCAGVVLLWLLYGAGR